MVRSSVVNCSTPLACERNPISRRYLRQVPMSSVRTTSDGRAAAHRGGSPMGSHLTQPYEGND